MSSSNLPKAVCGNYLRGESCRKDPNANPALNPCDRIHGNDINDPTGKDLYTTTLRVKVNTVPDILTPSAHPPSIGAWERERTPRPLYFPVPCLETYNVYKDIMTDSLYGVTPHSPQWIVTHIPATEDEALQAIHAMIVTLSEIRLLPPEVSYHLMQQYVRPMVEALPQAAHCYDPARSTWLTDRSSHRGGHWIGRDARPSRAILDGRLSRLHDAFIASLETETGHLRRHIHELQETTRWP